MPPPPRVSGIFTPSESEQLTMLVSLAGGVHSIAFNPVAPSTGCLSGFHLNFYNGGLRRL